MPAANERRSPGGRHGGQVTIGGASAPQSPAVATTPAAAALGAVEFARSMAALGVSPAATIACGCSGGADSLALTLLTADWVQGGGRVVALIVDHGLRRDSAAEAATVAGWLTARGIEAEILPWLGCKPAANVAATARMARYGLLGTWCQRHGATALLVAHHLEDQAETFMLRLARGSGVDGLAAMTPVARVPGFGETATTLRLLRPLLAVPRARLRALLRDRGQPWIEDPSNQNPAYARSRMRALLPRLAEEGLTPARLAATAHRLQRVRSALSQMRDEVLRRAVVLHPAGFAELDGDVLTGAPEEVALRALAWLLATVGGNPLPPRLERLERLLAALRERPMVRGRTLMGCRLLAWRGRFVLCREFAAIAPPLDLAVGQSKVWDRRFVVSLPAPQPSAAGTVAPTLSVAALGTSGWSDLRRMLRRAGREAAPVAKLAAAMPAAARAALPALWDLDGLRAVPHLQYWHESAEGGFDARFKPLVTPGCVVAVDDFLALRND